MSEYEKRRAFILVKAYPQPSQQYEETVCVAAVTEDHQLIRLYPIRYRHLGPAQRFTRFDLIEAEMTRAVEDPRPESFRVKEESIRIAHPGGNLSPVDRVRLWKPCVLSSLTALYDSQRLSGQSLGIVCPDPGSIRFKFQPIARASDEDNETSRSIYRQQSLLEDSLTPLPEPEYVFKYEFRSDGHQHSMQLHDWEVETTYHQYVKRYGSREAALEKMVEYYDGRVPTMNPHIIVGNMHKRPWQFIAIGLLRTTADVQQADAQGLLAL